MADKEISGITVAAALDGTEEAHVLQGANSRRVSMDNIAARSGFARVRVVATANVAIATELEDGDTLDSVTLAEGDWVLLTAQSTAAECGVYAVVAAAAGAASRVTAFSTYDQLAGAYFSVMEGTANADTLWRCTSDRGGTIDTTDVVIAEFSAGGATAPTRTTTALSGTSQTISIPAGCTWFRIQTDTSWVGFIGLTYDSGGATDQLWSGSDGSGLTGFVTTAGGNHQQFATVWAPRDASKKSMAWGVSSARTRYLLADSAQDDDTIKFTAVSGNMSGNVEIEWFYN